MALVAVPGLGADVFKARKVIPIPASALAAMLHTVTSTNSCEKLIAQKGICASAGLAADSG